MNGQETDRLCEFVLDDELRAVAESIPGLVRELGGDAGVDSFIERDLSRVCGGETITKETADRYRAQFLFAAASAVLGLKYVNRKFPA
jgi:hypothetical protein